jgi:uncharacterized protein YjbI with pentapeptide repeats
LRNAVLRDADLRAADLTGAIVDGALLVGALCDRDTIWPDGFDRTSSGVSAVEE